MRATFFGWALGFVMILVLIGILGLAGLGDAQFPVGLGMGAGVGLLQARLIARHVGRRRWAAASAAGMALPFIASDLAGAMAVPLRHSLPVAVVSGGFVAGVMQWRLLAKRSGAAAWWIPASVMGRALAASTVAFNERFLPKIPGLVGALLYVAVILAGGILLGAATGPALRRILETGETGAIP